jgi:hypothetical protein
MLATAVARAMATAMVMIASGLTAATVGQMVGLISCQRHIHFEQWSDAQRLQIRSQLEAIGAKLDFIERLETSAGFLSRTKQLRDRHSCRFYLPRWPWLPQTGLRPASLTGRWFACIGTKEREEHRRHEHINMFKWQADEVQRVKEEILMIKEQV